MGPVKCSKKFETDGASWQSVVELFESKGFTEEDALLQARVARILRYEDYDFEKKEVILWTPTQK